MKAIYRKEVRSYFNSMIGYVIIGMMLLAISLYYAIMNLTGGYPSFGVALYSTSVFLIVFIPILTMRSFAEERRSKTDQLLLTSPVSIAGIVNGKFLALATVFAVPLAVSCIYPIILRVNGGTSVGPDYATIFAYFLLGCFYISIGMFVSAHTENQIISAVITAVVLFVLYNWDTIDGVLPTTSRNNLIALLVIIALVALWLWATTKNPWVAAIFATVCVVAAAIVYKVDMQAYASLIANALSFMSFDGILINIAGYKYFDVKGVVLLITCTALMLFLTEQTIQKRRWS